MHILERRDYLLVTANEVKVSLGVCVTGGGRRGKVKGFSRGSKTRLLTLINSLVFDTVVFITLTYRYNQTDPGRAYDDLKAWHRKMVQDHGACGCVWKGERQKRGAMHYHIFAFDAPVEWSLGAAIDAWMDVTDQDGDMAARKYGVDYAEFDRLAGKDFAVVVAYLAKYAIKDGEEIKARSWGCLGRKYLRQVSTRYDLRGADIVDIFGKVLRAGGRTCAIDGGGTTIRLYRGHIGSVGDGSDIFGYIALPSQKVEVVVDYEQLTFTI